MKFLLIILTLFTYRSIAAEPFNASPYCFVPNSPNDPAWLEDLDPVADAELRASLQLAAKNVAELADGIDITTLTVEEAAAAADVSEYASVGFISEVTIFGGGAAEGAAEAAVTGLAVLGGAAIASIVAGGFVLAAIGLGSWQLAELIKDVKHWNNVSLLRPLKNKLLTKFRLVQDLLLVQ